MDEVRTTSEQTIEELKSRPGATDIFERFGLHHCCTTHLSLREAALAGGVSLATLVDALDALPTLRLEETD